MTAPEPPSADAPDGKIDFGALAVLLGFLTPGQRDQVLELQREAERSGGRKRFGELCLEKKLLTLDQFFVILQAQGKRVLACRSCGKSFNVHAFSSRETYQCGECGSALAVPLRPPEPGVHDSVLITQTELRTAVRRAPLPISPELVGLFPQFEILKEVGQGGMGTVFKVREKEGGALLALKVLAPYLASDGHYVRRFFREAKNLEKLDHPNIVASFGAGEAGDFKYLLMEYVQGAPLSRVLKRRGKLRELQALKIVRDVARGLDYAWHYRIIHRDVKPENIMVGRDNVVKLCDLGLSKELGGDVSRTTTSLKCTPAYASPEQIQGLSDCDCRSDTYSLGVSLYEMAVGELPFRGKHLTAYLFGHLQQAPPHPLSRNPALSQDTGKLILRMMEKDRMNRPEPGEVAKVLSRYLSRFGSL